MSLDRGPAHDLAGTMKDALAERPDAVSLACLDTRSGLLLGMQVRDDLSADAEGEVVSAFESCCEGHAAGSPDGTVVASAVWLHAYTRVPSRRDLVVVGVAPIDANVTHLRSWLRNVAERIGADV